MDEISILSPRNIEEAYQSAMKAKEKIIRKQNARRGWGTGRGRGQSYGRGRTANNSEEGSSSKTSGTEKKETELEEEVHIREEEEMVEEEGLPISATGATSGGTSLLSVLKWNKLVKEEHMLHN